MSAAASRENALVQAARSVAKLQRQISKHQREIKRLRADLKHERKVLRALASAAGQQSVPSRVFGPGVGLAAPASMKPERVPTVVEDLAAGFEDAPQAPFTGRSTKRAD
jgi:hypothetical protein